MKTVREIGKKLLLITAVIMMVLNCAPAHVQAEVTVVTVDPNNVGIHYLELKRNNMSTDVYESSSIPGHGDVGSAPDYNPIAPGKKYTTIYRDAFKYAGHDYSVKLEITYKGTNFFHQFIHNNARDGGWIEGVYYGKHNSGDTYDDIFLNAFGLNYEITVSFWNNPACTDAASLYAGIVLSDPDQGNYTLNTPVNTIYCINKGQVGGSRKLKDAYTYTSTSITHIKEGDDLNHVSWDTWPDFDEGEFGIYNDTPTHSYTYTVEGKQDVIRVLSKIILVKVPYNVHYFYQNEDGTYNELPDFKTEDNYAGGTRYANAGSSVSVTAADQTPETAEGYENYYLDTTKVAEGTKTVTDDGKTVLNVYFKKSTYNVHYFYQNDNGTYNETPDFKTEDNYAGGTRYATSSTVSVTNDDKIPDQDNKGNLYFLDEAKNESWTKTPVADDGTTVLNVYFKKIGYNVEYYYQTEGHYNDDPDFKTETPRYATYGTTEVEATEDDKTPNPVKGPQYILDPDTTVQTQLKKDLAADGSTILRVFFKEDLKVTYHDNANKEVFEDDLKPDLEYGTNPTPSFSGSTNREGYDFLGWSKKPEDKTNLMTQEQINNITVTEVADYWAQWEPWKYTIKYEPNGGSGEMEDNVYLLADKKMESDLNRFKRSGYKFTGFLYTDPEGHQTMYKDINDFREQFMKLGKNSVIVLVAQWTKEKEKTTTYNLPVTGVK